MDTLALAARRAGDRSYRCERRLRRRRRQPESVAASIELALIEAHQEIGGHQDRAAHGLTPLTVLVWTVLVQLRA